MGGGNGKECSSDILRTDIAGVPFAYDYAHGKKRLSSPTIKGLARMVYDAGIKPWTAKGDPRFANAATHQVEDAFVRAYRELAKA